MNSVCRDIFRAVHEGKWLSIEYRNKEGEKTSYWVGIKAIDVRRRALKVDGLHLSLYTLRNLLIYIDSILSASVVEGSYHPVCQELVEDIKLNPVKYQPLFGNVANLKILNYLMDCSRLDVSPYRCEYSLLEYFDGDRLAALPTFGTHESGADLPTARQGRRKIRTEYPLTATQFQQIVKNFQIKAQSGRSSLKIKQLCLNVMSIYYKEGLYVLAYRRLNLDVKARALKPDEDVTICHEYTVDGNKASARRFLDADDYVLLDDFEKNAEQLKDRITASNQRVKGVDDMPYLIALELNSVDLNRDYNGIIKMCTEGKATYPIKAFFGELLARPDRRKEYPLALLERNVNLDQLRAIHSGIKYPLTYIQGPPGTGKTTTIMNAIMTAFFNGKTVLFTSYNNHPIDGVFQKLTGIPYQRFIVPFPIVRLGNNEKVGQAMDYIREIYERTKPLTIYASTLEKNKEDKIRRTKELTVLLKKREEILDLLERKEAIERLLASNRDLRFHTELEGRQLASINKRLAEIGQVSDEEAKALLTDDEAEFVKYLYYTSAKYIQKLKEEKNRELMDIVYMEERDKQVEAFNKYIGKEENLEQFLKIFPIVATTCISARKLGEPKPVFDMVIMDEASQCGTATALLPIVRGERLMLVGDPQQLNPVILLDEKDNQTLKKKYGISQEYDYIKNSIYKVYLACDSVSDEVLLRCHYRCNRKIIEFNNKKYYNNKLEILSKSESKQPLLYMDVTDDVAAQKNTAPEEARQIVEYANLNKDKKIGVITPFVNQREYINQMLKEKGLSDVTCGTIHAFQGDEKDVILFSLALTDKTHAGTYNWLKNYKELINVATSRAKDQLIILSSTKNLERLHRSEESDDIYELVEYVRSNGTSKVTERTAASRALGIKPYSTETEEAFLANLNHALGNILYNEYEKQKYIIRKEVGISQVFEDNPSYEALFYSGRFDFVVYERTKDKRELPVFAIELDGKEHVEDEVVRERDRKKNKICMEHGFELLRIENSYARRYNYIKDILIRYFSGK